MVRSPGLEPGKCPVPETGVLATRPTPRKWCLSPGSNRDLMLTRQLFSAVKLERQVCHADFYRYEFSRLTNFI